MLKKASGPENTLVFLSFFQYHPKDVWCIRFREIREGSHMAEKLPIIIDNRGENTVLHALQRLLPNLQKMDVPTGVFEVTEATLVDQPEKTELEYRVIAVNKVGEGQAGNTVMVVL